MKNKLLYSGLFILIVLIVCGCENCEKKVKKNEAVAKLFINYWNAHNIEMLISLFAEDCLYEEVATGRSYSSKEGIAAYAKSTISGVPDSKFEIITIIADSEMATVEWVWKGSNSVGWEELGIPATDKYFELRGVSVMKIENGLIRRNSDYWDWNTFKIMIGAK